MYVTPITIVGAGNGNAGIVPPWLEPGIPDPGVTPLPGPVDPEPPAWGVEMVGVELPDDPDTPVIMNK